MSRGKPRDTSQWCWVVKFKVLWQGQLPKVSVFWTLWTVAAFRVYRLSVNQKYPSLQSCFRANLIKQCSILEYICCVWRVFAHFVPIQIDHYFSCQLKQGRYSCIPHPKKRGTIWLMPEWFLLTTIFTMERSDRDPYKAISVCTLFTGCHFLSVWNHKLFDISIASEANAKKAAFGSRLLCRPTTGFPRFFHRCVWTLNNDLTEQILLLPHWVLLCWSLFLPSYFSFPVVYAAVSVYGNQKGDNFRIADRVLIGPFDITAVSQY